MINILVFTILNHVGYLTKTLAIIKFATILDVFQFAQSVAVIVGLIIALRTYKLQVRQERLNNSFSLLETFTKHIKEEDISILGSIYQNTYEGCGADRNCFVTFYQGQIQQHPIVNLFISEGRGVSVLGSLEISKEPSDSKEPSEKNLQGQYTDLGSIRLIAEQLNIIAYEVFQGEIEIRIVYYELSSVIEIVCTFLDIAIREDVDSFYNLRERFKYLLKMKAKFSPKKFPKRSFFELS